mgnify:CR=1 FL=1
MSYKENDISWIWDIDFEILNDKSIKNIILIGKFCYDLHLRMKYAEIDEKKIILTNIVSIIIFLPYKPSLVAFPTFHKML